MNRENAKYTQNLYNNIKYDYSPSNRPTIFNSARLYSQRYAIPNSTSPQSGHIDNEILCIYRIITLNNARFNIWDI